jgi:hypothetical protein
VFYLRAIFLELSRGAQEHFLQGPETRRCLARSLCDRQKKALQRRGHVFSYWLQTSCSRHG